MPIDSADSQGEGPPNLDDITPWLLTYVRSNYAEHQSKLFDETPGPAIQAIVQWTLAALVVNATDEDDLPELIGDNEDAEETGEGSEGTGEEEGPQGGES
jgi:hypothetical protein